MNQLGSAVIAAAFLLVASTAGAAESLPAKSVQLSKVVLDTETSELSARVKGGTLCVFPSKVTIPKEKKTQNYERFDNLFSQRMKSGGFTTVSTSSDMFAGADNSPKGDYLIGVTLHPVSMNLCDSVKGDKGDVTIAADWQIFDRAAGKVVETVTTSGVGSQDKFAVDGQKQMINQAFTANLTALIQKGVLQKYVGAVSSN